MRIHSHSHYVNCSGDSRRHSKATSQARHSRSIGVQTEGKVAPYPQGSSWLDSASSAMARSSQLVVSGGGGTGSGTVMRVLGDERSIDMQSMPSMWGPGASLSLTSTASDENYSIKSASYALPQPSSSATSKHKAMSKMRHNAQRQQQHPGGGAQFRNVEQILQDAKSRSHGVKLVMPKNAEGHGPARLGSDEGAQPPPSSGASVSSSANSSLADLQYGPGPSSSSKHRSFHQQQLVSKSAGGSGSLMAIAGQGFVSPFSLPRL